MKRRTPARMNKFVRSDHSYTDKTLAKCKKLLQKDHTYPSKHTRTRKPHNKHGGECSSEQVPEKWQWMRDMLKWWVSNARWSGFIHSLLWQMWLTSSKVPSSSVWGSRISLFFKQYATLCTRSTFWTSRSGHLSFFFFFFFFCHIHDRLYSLSIKHTLQHPQQSSWPNFLTLFPRIFIWAQYHSVSIKSNR